MGIIFSQICEIMAGSDVCLAHPSIHHRRDNIPDGRDTASPTINYRLTSAG
ncbi:hypothetical protein GS572_22160 [Escherichia coli]|nr:hypothetical protein [Escherichia coli]